MILGEGEGEFKLVLCDEVGAHFCVVSSRIVNAEFYSEKNKQIYAALQREILQAKVHPRKGLSLTSDRIESCRFHGEIPLGRWSDNLSWSLGRTPVYYRSTQVVPKTSSPLPTTTIPNCFHGTARTIPSINPQEGDRDERPSCHFIANQCGNLNTTLRGR
jgi:hypothetical protein